MKKILEEYFDTPDKRAKLYLLITLAQIWAVIAMSIGVIIFIYFILREMGLLIL